ncbi:MAG: hypothetical protein ACRED7_03860 [Stellaceae bacterium]
MDRRLRVLAMVLAASCLLVGVSHTARAQPPTVKVTLNDQKGKAMTITLSQATAKAGPVSFEVTNASKNLVHEFLIAPWSGEITSLPYDAKEQAVEESKIRNLQGVEDMPADTRATILLNLPPGKYVVFCNQIGHYKMGMVAAFTVTR